MENDPKLNVRDTLIVQKALKILERRMKEGDQLNAPSAVRDYVRLKIGFNEFEAFGCIWLNAQNRVIAAEELFHGTLTQTSVFPREVVKRGLHLNAAGVILYHNHPSGTAEPSRADEALTQTLKHTLALVDIKVLDHFVVGVSAMMSFAERGLL